MTSRLIIALSLLVLLLAACSGSGSSAAPSAAAPSPAASTAASGPASAASGGELTILAAASLKGALEQAKTAYEAANPGTTLVVSTDSSSAVETQIEQGAPADVFLAADTTNPQQLVDKG